MAPMSSRLGVLENRGSSHSPLLEVKAGFFQLNEVANRGRVGCSFQVKYTPQVEISELSMSRGDGQRKTM